MVICKITYTGSEESCILNANSDEKTLSSLTGDAGSEVLDTNFGTAGEIDLTDPLYNTIKLLIDYINDLNDYEAELVSGDEDLDYSSENILNSVSRAEDNGAYILFNVESVLNDDALLSWEFVKETLEFSEEQKTFVEKIINAASKTAARITKRRLKAETYTQLYDGNDSESMLLEHYPVNSITSLKIDTSREFGDDTEIESTYYRCEEGSGIIRLYNDRFPDKIDCIQVVYNAGYENIPDDLQLAMLEIIKFNSTRIKSHGIGIKSEHTAEGMDITREITIPQNAWRTLELYEDKRL